MIKSLVKYYKFSFTITTLTIILSFLMIKASTWQWERYKQKVSLLETYKTHTTAKAIDLPLENIDENAVIENLLNKKISVTGTFDFNKQIIITNRKDASGPGHYLLAPFKIKGSEKYIIISRGFIPFADRNPDNWGKYDYQEKEETISGVAKKSIAPLSIGPKNPKVGANLPFATLWYYEEITKMAKQLPYPLITSIFLQQITSTENYPKQAISIDVPPSTHFGYTIEWAILAIITLIASFIWQCFRGKKLSRLKVVLILFSFSFATNSAAETNLNKPVKSATIRQNLERQIDLNLEFTSQTGEAKKLSNFLLADRPLIIAPVYYGCPRLCSLTLEGLAKLINSLDLKLNKDYKFLSISINPNETAKDATEKANSFYPLLKTGEDSFAGTEFLTGKAENINSLMEQLGFEYYQDGNDYVHQAAIMIITPAGKISRYFIDIKYTPEDIRYSLIEASLGKIGNIADNIFLLCFRFDPTQGRYSFAIWRFTQVFCILFVLFFANFLIKLRKKYS